MSALAEVTKPAAQSTDDLDLVAAVRAGDDRAFELLFERYQTPHRGLRARDGARPRPRRGHHAGGLHLGAAPDARDRPRDHLQAVDLRDREERLHRRVSPRAQHERGVASTPRTRSARPTTAGSPRPAPAPDAAIDTKQSIDNLCGAFGGLSRAAPRHPRHARVRGPLLPRDRRPAGHEPRGRREHALPRPPPAQRGVRGARQRRALPARARDRRRRRRPHRRAARPAPARAPHLALPAVPALRAARRRRRRGAARSGGGRRRRSPRCCRCRRSCAAASTRRGRSRARRCTRRR